MNSGSEYFSPDEEMITISRLEYDSLVNILYLINNEPIELSHHKVRSQMESWKREVSNLLDLFNLK